MFESYHHVPLLVDKLFVQYQLNSHYLVVLFRLIRPRSSLCDLHRHYSVLILDFCLNQYHRIFYMIQLVLLAELRHSDSLVDYDLAMLCTNSDILFVFHHFSILTI